MKYFIDTEFHEYKRRPYWSRPVDTIELISIGIVSEDGKEFYAISKDFDVRAAWNNEWLRENVLKPIHLELLLRHSRIFLSKQDAKEVLEILYKHKNEQSSLLKEFDILINKYGMSNNQIAQQIKEFCANPHNMFLQDSQGSMLENRLEDTKEIMFYGYYSGYDWVVFCWLFGRMIDLPKGFPMYCIDLKQILDEKASFVLQHERFYKSNHKLTQEGALQIIKDMPNYPKQTNEHNALADAKWTLSYINLHKKYSNMYNTKKAILIFLMASISAITVFVATSCAIRMVSAPNTIEVFAGLGVLLLIAVFNYLFTIKLIKYVNKK